MLDSLKTGLDDNFSTPKYIPRRIIICLDGYTNTLQTSCLSQFYDMLEQNEEQIKHYVHGMWDSVEFSSL